jgi:hypothetical protein
VADWADAAVTVESRYFSNSPVRRRLPRSPETHRRRSRRFAGWADVSNGSSANGPTLNLACLRPKPNPPLNRPQERIKDAC